jgi:hypothetical protein
VQQAATNAQQNAAKTQSYTDIGIGVGSILADK